MNVWWHIETLPNKNLETGGCRRLSDSPLMPVSKQA